MKTNWFKRTLCSILALVLVLGYVPVQTIAAESDGLCEHHTQHTAECGYSPAVEGHDCGHEHTDECYDAVTDCAHVHGDCGYVPAVEGHDCDCQPNDSGEIVHTEGCGYVAAVVEVPCGHVCSEESGCITQELNCRHEHDSKCGYVEAVQESPCTFRCEECGQAEGAVPITFLEAGYQDGIYCYHVEAKAGDSIALHPIADYVDTALEYQWLRWDSEQKDYAPISLEDNSGARSDTLDIDVSDRDFCEEPAYMCILNAGNRVGKVAFLIRKKVDAQTPVAISGAMEMAGVQAYTSGTSISSDYTVKKLSEAGKTFIKNNEGLRLTAYWDVNGYAIGYGHHGSDITEGMTITLAQADAYFESDVIRFENVVNTMAKDNGVTLTQAQFDALTDFSFNEGDQFTGHDRTIERYLRNGWQNYSLQEWIDAFCLFDVGNAPLQARHKRQAEYFYNGSVSEVANDRTPVLSISGWRDLTQLDVGSNFGLRGTVSTDYGVITSVTGSVLNSSGGVVLTHTDTPNTSTYNIQTGINNYLSFGSLSSGRYTIKVQATANNNGKTNTQELVNQSFTVGATNNYSFDINGLLDNTEEGNLGSFGTCDVYINGVLVADNCADYYSQDISGGSTYEIRDIRATDGHNYAGVYAGQLSGTVSTNTEVVLKFFSNPKATLSQNATDIVVEKNGAYITYSYTGDTAHGYGCTVESSNPSVATVNFVEGEAFAVWGVSVGTCKILFQLVETDTNVILDTAECTVEVSRAGTFGDGLKYNVTPDGHMTISGNGEIPDYDKVSPPWQDWQNEITQLAIENGVTRIGWSAFLHCESLQEVEIADSVREIETSAFAFCTSLKKVVIPKGVNKVCESFVSCTALENVVVSEGVTTLVGSFFKCTSLKSVTISASVTSIGEYTFGYCSSLADIYYGGTPKEWGKVTIEEGNDALTAATIHYGKEDTNLGGTCGEELTWTLDNGTLTISGTGEMANYSGVSPDGTQGTPPPWYSVRESISKIVIEEGVTSIGSWAFNTCTNVTSVSIPSSVTTIGEAAFFGCSGLTEVTLPSSIPELGNLNFAYCTSLSSISLPDNLQVIGDNAFLGCTQLSSVSIPNSVSLIRSGSFQGCTSLTSVNIPNSVASIGMFAFFDCTSLKAVIIPDTVTFIGDYSFGFYGETRPYSKDDGFVITTPRASEGYFYAKENNIALNTQGVYVPKCMNAGVASVDMSVYARENDTDSQILGTIPKGNVVQPYVISQMGGGPEWGLVMGIQDTDGSITWGQFSAEELADTTKELIRGWVCLDGVEEIVSGTCGENLTWTLVNGVLTVSGIGEMDGMVAQKIECVSPWKDYQSKIQSVVIEEGVTSIGGMCFTYCRNLEQVSIPSTVEHIDPFAFFGSGLKQVAIPAGVREIGNAAFGNCGKLQSITVEDGNANYCAMNGILYDHAVNTLLVYPATKTDASFTVPASVSIIDNFACVSAQFVQVTLPPALRRIGSFAFTGCDNLEKISIPAIVSSIGPGAFETCGNLTEISFAHSSVATLAIEKNAFCLNSPVSTNVLVPDEKDIHASISGYDWTGSKRNVTYCRNEAAILGSGTCGDNLTWEMYNNGTLIISGSGKMVDVGYYEQAPWDEFELQITTVDIRQGVTSIGDFAFKDCSNMTKVSIPNSVTSMGEGLFYECSSLTSISIPGGVDTIDWCAFYNCSNLIDVTIPNGVKSIGHQAFSGCSKLANVTIPNSVTFIGEHAFSGCQSLTSVTVPGDIKSLPNYIFSDCSQLTSVVICNGVESIGEYAFEDCSELTNISIPNTVTTIGLGAFAFCSNLESLTIPESVTSIKFHSFKYCTSLKSIVIPSSVTDIEESIFYNCSNLTDVTILGAIESITSHMFCNCPKLTSVTIPNSVTSIGDCAFSGCSNLESIVIPNNVTSIGVQAFCGCTGLSSIAIPMSVSSIGEEAFRGCDTLKSITFEHTSSKSLTIGEGAFFLEIDTVLDTRILVPDPQDIHASLAGYDWAGSNRNASYFGKNRLDLGNAGLSSQSGVWINGVEYPVQKDSSGASYVSLPDDAPPILVTYSYNNSADDAHTQYPIGMQAYRIHQTATGATVERLPELDNLLQYSGSSIRIVGNKGIRMITSVNQDTRNALTGNGLAGFKLLEYGTLLAQTSKMCDRPLVLGGGDYVRTNYAYKKDVADPVFKYADGLIQYTNVLVGFNDDQCAEDIAMRPYMKLLDENGEEFVIYGGIVYRSIGYIAYQNRAAFPIGSAAYEYVWSIIHNVYGDVYDAEYKK